jgi:GNAT superfamily N-acetyltransferase
VRIQMLQAGDKDARSVLDVLSEAARYLDSIGQALWRCDELSLESVAKDIDSGLYYLAWMDGESVGTLKFQLEDPVFWPDIPPGSSAYVHRIAVRRRVAGMGISSQMLTWAKQRTKEAGRTALRLDCELRPKLCAIYERNGFVKHSERQVGPYYVARYEYKVEHGESG